MQWDLTLALIYLRETRLKVTRSQTEELDGAAGLNRQQVLRREAAPDGPGYLLLIFTEEEECESRIPRRTRAKR